MCVFKEPAHAREIPFFSALIEEEGDNRSEGLWWLSTIFIFFAQVSYLSAISFGEVGKQLDGDPFIGMAFVLQQDADQDGLLLIASFQANGEEGIGQSVCEGGAHKGNILRGEGFQVEPSDKAFWEHTTEEVLCLAGIVEQELEKVVVGFRFFIFHAAKIGHVRA